MGKQRIIDVKDLIPGYIQDIHPYEPGKPIEEVERELGIKEIIKLASNENALGPSPLSLEAIQNYLNRLHLYPDGSSYYLRQKLAHKIGGGITMDHIILGCGSSELIELTAKVFLNHRLAAIIAEPSFIMYSLCTQFVGATQIKVPCKNLTHDLSAMLEKITPNTTIIYIANPNNPTGTIVEDDEFQYFMKEVPENVVVVVDEAYREYIDYDKYPMTLPHVFGPKKLIILRTFSKIYGLAGLRIGYGIADPEIISYLHKVRQPFNVNTLGQYAAIAALDDEEHVRKSRELNEKGKNYLYSAFEKLQLVYTKTYANFILVQVEQDPMDLFRTLLKKGVIVRPVSGYGLKNPIRITIGTQSENEKLVESLQGELC